MRCHDYQIAASFLGRLEDTLRWVFVFAMHGRVGDADLVGRLRDAPEDPVGRRGDSLLLVGHRIGQGALDERCH